MKVLTRAGSDNLIILQRTSLVRIGLPLLLLVIMPTVIAQQNFNIADPLYGSDPLVINGRYYSFFPSFRTEGNQYLAGPGFDTGSVTIRGKTYSDLTLNYDIYNQQLLLKFRNTAGADNLIIISEAWLERFSFRGMSFKLIHLQDTAKSIFQIVGSGSVRIGYKWKKDLKPDSFHGALYYSFSPPKKEMNILSGCQMVRYKNNRTFCAAFDEKRRTAVREYLARHRINVKKAADSTMSEVIGYYNSMRTE